MRASDAIRMAQRHLGGERGPRNKLAAPSGNGFVSSTIQGLVYIYVNNAPPAGAVIQIDDELIYVWSVNTSTKTMTVERGWGGTTRTQHVENSIIEINPKYTGLFEMLQDEVRSLEGEGLYRIKSVTLPYNDLRYGVDISSLTDRQFFYGLQVTIGSSEHWVPEWWLDEENLRFYTIPDNRTVRVFYAAPFAAPTSADDDLK
nr:hypothetical protein [Euzebyales bacterium]